MGQMEDRKFNELLAVIKRDFPELRFRAGVKFAFRPRSTIIIPSFLQVQDNTRSENKKVYSVVEQKICSLRLLHELGHATSGHYDFTTDIERLKMEREAWEKAHEYCSFYGVEYDEDFVEGELDSYRDWLHQRSKCPNCGQTRYQAQDGRYVCPFCRELSKLSR